MSANRFTKYLLIALIVVAALVTLGFGSSSKKAAPADKSFDAIEKVRVSRSDSALDSAYASIEQIRLNRSVDSSWEGVEQIRLSRSVNSSWEAVEQIRASRSGMVEHNAYDSLEALRLLRASGMSKTVHYGSPGR
ncbi:MAG TPA: hypothetical protein VIV15_08725 [Anaerolineales bacterium]